MLELGSSEITYEEVPIWLLLGLNLPWEPENLVVKDLPEAPLHVHLFTQNLLFKILFPLLLSSIYPHVSKALTGPGTCGGSVCLHVEALPGKSLVMPLGAFAI